MRRLLYIDSSYTLSQIRERGLDDVLRIRFLDGYFDRVWSAHPVDTHPTAKSELGLAGKPVFENLSADHVFVRGRYGRYPTLARIAPLNVLMALGSFVAALVRLVRREKISVIRAGDPLLCGLIGLIVARLTGKLLVVRVNAHNDMIRADTGTPMMPSLFRFHFVEKFIEKVVLSRADGVVAPSQYYADFAKKKGALVERIAIVRYGNLIDRRHLVAPSERALLDDAAFLQRLNERRWMVHVGRLHRLKHAEDCYDVVSLLAGQGSDVGLLLVGDGPLRDVIKQRAENDGLSDRVLLLGNVNQDVLAKLLPQCTLALSPLTGRALAEVAFAGLPIVAYDLDWQREIVETDVTGVLVPAFDIKKMAEGAAWLLQDAECRKQFGEAARARAFNLLDPEVQTREEVNVYASLLDKSGLVGSREQSPNNPSQ